MSLLAPFLFVLLGLGILIKGADFLVDGSSSLAKRFRVSDIMIGLTVVAFGTSTPELTVNLFSAFSGTTDLAIGTILGSNIANIFLILGIAAVITPLAVKKNTVWKEIPLSLLAALLVWVMANDLLIDGIAPMQLSRSDGLVFIAFFVLFLYYVFGIARVEGSGTEVHARSFPRSVGMVVTGFALLVFGGWLCVEYAVKLARLMEISEVFIGLTIVAIGTSLPELATSSVAAWKGNVDIAVGNVVGSNIFNIFWILGLTAVMKPLPFTAAMNVDILVTILASLFLFLALFVGKRHVVERWQGVGFIGMYIGYIVYIVSRG